MRRRGVQRLLLVVMLVYGYGAQGQLQLLGALVGQTMAQIDGIHILLDAEDQVQEGFHQQAQRYEAKKPKDHRGDQCEEEDAQCEGIEDGEEGNELDERIEHMTHMAEVFLLLLLEQCLVVQQKLELAEGRQSCCGCRTLCGGHQLKDLRHRWRQLIVVVLWVMMMRLLCGIGVDELRLLANQRLLRCRLLLLAFLAPLLLVLVLVSLLPLALLSLLLALLAIPATLSLAPPAYPLATPSNSLSLALLTVLGTC